MSKLVHFLSFFMQKTYEKSVEPNPLVTLKML